MRLLLLYTLLLLKWFLPWRVEEEGKNDHMLQASFKQKGKHKISYLIIGNGIAGVTAAEILRTEDPQASIGVIADDPCPVYYRPALKDYLGGHVSTEKLWARPATFYRDANISFLPDRVIGLDSKQHIVLLQSQKQVYYDKLLLANGASPARLNCPGNNLRGVTTLRTVTDYQNVLERLNTVRRVVVCGSGTLALETAESLRQRGLEVSHLLRRTTLWSEVLDTTASDLVLQEERRAGIEVCLEEEIVKINGSRGEVTSVSTNRGRRISCQMVLVAIGIEPNIKPWQASGVACGRGVRVDNALRTNLPDIYAAGDLIEVYDRLTNRTRLLGQWYPAIMQARIAASSMLGRIEEGKPLRTKTRLLSTYNATFLYGLDFASAGLTIMPNQSGYEELIAEPQPRSYRKVILKDGIPVGMLTLGDRKQALALKRAIDHRVNLLSVASLLFTADFNLRAWLDEQGVPPPILAVGSERRPARSSRTSLGSREITPIPTASGELTGGEKVMTDSTSRQVRQVQGPAPVYWMQGADGQAQGSVPTGGQAQDAVSTDYEALLVQLVDPALRLHVAETPLSQLGDGLTQGQPLRIGRQAGVDLLLNEGSVSRQHAEISYVGGHYLLRDLGSTSGTFVNEQPLESPRLYVLQPNDILRFGNIVRLKFLLRIIHHPPTQIQPVPSQNNRKDNVARPSDTTTRMPVPAPRTDSDWLLDQNPIPTVGGVPNAYGTRDRVGAGDRVGMGDRVGARHDPHGQEQLKKAPSLVIVPEGSGQNGIPPQIHVLNPGQRITIGREEDNTIILTDPTISRHHAEVFLNVQNGKHSCYIHDLQSTYGTLVNQTKIGEAYLLSHGDRIKLGSTRIFYIDLQAGKESTTKSVAVRRGTRVTQNTTGLETNVAICPRCGVANAPVARFCASCSTLIWQG
jgi:NADPH-dependent 2,4-dienoyl-CoA reductase/sulfur reductase-like enzyme/pSer/pThr/pTyr-binding forkhead associated (FHA) protein